MQLYRYVGTLSETIEIKSDKRSAFQFEQGCAFNVNDIFFHIRYGRYFVFIKRFVSHSFNLSNGYEDKLCEMIIEIHPWAIYSSPQLFTYRCIEFPVSFI